MAPECCCGEEGHEEQAVSVAAQGQHLVFFLQTIYNDLCREERWRMSVMIDVILSSRFLIRRWRFCADLFILSVLRQEQNVAAAFTGVV